jgi:L-lactate dehydrogenase (cytochrome)
LRANRTDFQKLAFLPRVLTDVSVRDQATTVLGETLTSPLLDGSPSAVSMLPMIEIDVDLALLGRGSARQLDASALAWM